MAEPEQVRLIVALTIGPLDFLGVVVVFAAFCLWSARTQRSLARRMAEQHAWGASVWLVGRGEMGPLVIDSGGLSWASRRGNRLVVPWTDLTALRLAPLPGGSFRGLVRQLPFVPAVRLETYSATGAGAAFFLTRFAAQSLLKAAATDPLLGSALQVAPQLRLRRGQAKNPDALPPS